MKIVFVTAGMGGGGSERVMANLSNYLVELGHEVLIVMTAEPEVAYYLDERVQIKCLGERTNGSIIKRLKRIMEIRKIIANDSRQTIISFGTETNLFTTLANLFLKNRLIISERNDPNQCKYPRIRNIIYRFADNYVFQTNNARDCFSNYIAKKSVVISNPIRTDLPNPFSGVRAKKVVAVGRLNYQKNHKLLIEAFADFIKVYPDYELVIYGKGELLNDLLVYTEELNINNYVRFAGFSETILQDILDASMYVLSSDFEGISNSLMEAMAIGLPVISTDCPIGGSAELIDSMVNGILVPVHDKEALEQAMKQIAEDSKLAETLATNAIKIKEHYSNNVICRRWMEYICK